MSVHIQNDVGRNKWSKLTKVRQGVRWKEQGNFTQKTSGFLLPYPCLIALCHREHHKQRNALTPYPLSAVPSHTLTSHEAHKAAYKLGLQAGGQHFMDSLVSYRQPQAMQHGHHPSILFQSSPHPFPTTIPC